MLFEWGQWGQIIPNTSANTRANAFIGAEFGGSRFCGAGIIPCPRLSAARHLIDLGKGGATVARISA